MPILIKVTYPHSDMGSESQAGTGQWRVPDQPELHNKHPVSVGTAMSRGTQVTAALELSRS